LCVITYVADFEVLQRAFDKANKLADKGDPKDWPPQFFIRCLVEIDDFVNEVRGVILSCVVNLDCVTQVHYELENACTDM
jgi:Eukaryotic translation initiation factor 3 subunit 8 N-terminus